MFWWFGDPMIGKLQALADPVQAEDTDVQFWRAFHNPPRANSAGPSRNLFGPLTSTVTIKGL
jgi:hypothetical protein